MAELPTKIAESKAERTRLDQKAALSRFGD